jgi:ABC-2 type transport system ATP-binding protein
MLELIEISKTYGSFTAVDRLSLKVEPGEALGLLGPNGAGKSTLVSIIAGILAPSAGQVRIGGQELTRHTRELKSKIGMVPQDIALYEPLTARDNLEFFGSLHGLSGSLLKERVREALDIVSLTDRQNEDVTSFSGGMKRRVNIAASLIHHPSLLILDEPTVGIDPQSRHQILETVKRLNREQGITVIYTSHYMEEVEQLCSRIAVVDHGRLAAEGTKQAIQARLGLPHLFTVGLAECGPAEQELAAALPGVRSAELRDGRLVLLLAPSETAAPDTLEALAKSGLKPTRFSFEEASLEQIFLNITGGAPRD